MSKLACGAAPQSLLVAPSSTPENYLRPLAAIARLLRGEMFAAVVPHPGQWGPTAPAHALYRQVTDGRLLVEG